MNLKVKPFLKRCWGSILLWRIISLLGIVLSIVFFVYPYQSHIFLESMHLKQPEKIGITLDRFNEREEQFHLPPFLEELNLNNSKLEGFTIKSPENNSVRLNNIHFWIKPKVFGKVGIIYIKKVHASGEVHISTENIRYLDNSANNPVKYIPFSNINPGNLPEKYKGINNEILIGAEIFDMQIDYLNPGEFVSFLIYYIPAPLLTVNESGSIDNFYWDLCYDYIHYEKLIPNKCIYNTESINSSQGRALDYMYPAEIQW